MLKQHTEKIKKQQVLERTYVPNLAVFVYFTIFLGLKFLSGMAFKRLAV